METKKARDLDKSFSGQSDAPRPANITSSLPARCTFDQSEVVLIVDHLISLQVASAYQLIRADADRGEDFGQDEFPTEDVFRSLIEVSDSFSLTDRNDVFRGVIALAPSSYCRSEHPPYADGLLACDQALKSAIFDGLVRLTLQLVRDLGYEGCLVDMFSASVRSVGTMQKEGFSVIGCVPKSGVLAGIGWAESLILFHDLSVISENKHTLESLQQKRQVETKTVSNRQLPATTESVATTSEEDVLKGALTSTANLSTNDGTLLSVGQSLSTVEQPIADPNTEVSRIMVRQQNRKPVLEYLPHAYSTTSGRAVTVRYMHEDELPNAFKLYSHAARSGNGFAAEEFPNVAIFKQFIYEGGHAFVAEEQLTSKALMYFSVMPSTYCRSSDPVAADLYSIVDPSSRGEGLGMEAARLCLRLAYDLGYHSVVTDVFLTNRTAWKILLACGFSSVGYIPQASYLAGSGWSDCAVMHKDLSVDTHHFAKL